MMSVLSRTTYRASTMLTRRATAVPLRNAHIGTRVDHAMRALQHADAVCFDVDSTVITSEALDSKALCFCRLLFIL